MKKYFWGAVFLILVQIFAVNSVYAEFKSGFGEEPSAPYVVPELLNIPLEWNPSSSISDMDFVDTALFKKKQIIVKPFSDARKNPAEIGKNIERRKADKELLVTTKSNVAQWMTDHFLQLWSEFDLASAKNNGTIIMESEVLKFYVTESTTYKASVALKIRLLSGAGRELWEGTITGSSSRSGRSYQDNNYTEALCNAYINLVYNMLRNEHVKSAFK